MILTSIGVNIARYPAILQHLRQWQHVLEQRQDIGEQWWELRACAYYAAFENPKIVFPVICKEPRFALDRDGMYSNDKTFILPKADLYLLGVLNSSPAWSYAKRVSSVLGDENRGGRLMLQWAKLRRLPIPEPRVSDRTAIEKLVQKCIDAKGDGCEAREKEIDERVAALYGR